MKQEGLPRMLAYSDLTRDAALRLAAEERWECMGRKAGNKMNENNRAILEMLEQGKISEEEAARLLDALEAQAEAGEEAPAGQDGSSSEPVPAGQEDGCSVVLNLGEGMRINVDSRDGVRVLDQEANGKV